jgi:proteic killer suppression protein
LRFDALRTTYYNGIVIRSFRCRDTEALFGRSRVARFANIELAALKRLTALHAASSVSDLLIPPGNRLEALKRDRAGQYSIRVNDQYRICFRWAGGDAHDVEIADYH